MQLHVFERDLSSLVSFHGFLLDILGGMVFHVLCRLHAELLLEALREIGRGVESDGVADFVDAAAALREHRGGYVQPFGTYVVVRRRSEQSLGLADEGGLAQAEDFREGVVSELGVAEVVEYRAVEFREELLV